MTHLITFPGDANLPSHSPFGLKAMCLLQMAGHSWAPEYVQDFSILPMGKVPVLRLKDRLVPDSHHIQAYLEELGTDFYPGLTQADKASAHMLIRMTEENLRLGLVYDRWLDAEVWPIMREMFFGQVPAAARDTVANGAQAQVRDGLMSEGIARFAPEDRLRRLTQDLDALQLTLGNKDFLFGDTPTAADAAVAPVLDMILQLPVDTGLKQAVQARANFAPYVTRVRAAIYPPMQMFAVEAGTTSDAEKLSA